jgi:hypothetical protein
MYLSITYNINKMTNQSFYKMIYLYVVFNTLLTDLDLNLEKLVNIEVILSISVLKLIGRRIGSTRAADANCVLFLVYNDR